MGAILIIKKMPTTKQSCKRHAGETPFMMTEQLYCSKCGKLYFVEHTTMDSKLINKPVNAKI